MEKGTYGVRRHYSGVTDTISIPHPLPTRCNDLHPTSASSSMLWTIIIILLVLWLLGFGFKIGGSLIHVLLVIALIVLIYRLLF
jgi:hypothetical protein